MNQVCQQIILRGKNKSILNGQISQLSVVNLKCNFFIIFVYTKSVGNVTSHKLGIKFRKKTMWISHLTSLFKAHCVRVRWSLYIQCAQVWLRSHWLYSKKSWFFFQLSAEVFHCINKMFVRSELINLHIVIIALVAPMVLVGGQRQGACCQEYCYNMDPERPQSAHFGSKTSYLIAKGPETGKQYLVPSKNAAK